MKKCITQTFRALSLSLILLVGMSNTSQACVMPEPTVSVHCDYDSNMVDVAIWVSNLNLFNAGPGQFCSCGITNFTDVFTNVMYVAFVDSGTTDPVSGFTPFASDADGSNAWEGVLATGNWDAYLAETVGAGLNSGAPTQMLIRASLPPGYTFSLLDSNLVVTQAGFDEWDNTNMALSNSHQSIVGFWDEAITYTEISPSSSFFSDLDNDVQTSVDDLINKSTAISVYPNPTQGQLHIEPLESGLEIETYQLSDVTGSLKLGKNVGRLSSEIELDIAGLTPGIYFLQMKTSRGVLTKKILLKD